MLLKKGGILAFMLVLHSLVYAQIFETIVEKFENNRRGWPILEESNYQALIIDNSYIICNTASTSKEFLSSFIIDPTHDYRIDVQFTQLEAENKTSFGFIWGNYIDRDDMTFLFQNKSYKITATVNSKHHLVKNWKRKGRIKKIGETNLLTIKKQDNIIKYYINGKRAYTSDNYPLVGTEVGFVLNGKAKVKIDFIKVSALKQSMFLVDNPINGRELLNLGPKVNSEFSERNPVISSDGKTLYITRTHPDNLNGTLNDDIWSTSLDEYGEWKHLNHAEKPLNNKGDNFVISITPDGNSLLLANTYKRDGSADKSGISIAEKRDREWQVPQKQTIKNYKNNDPYGSFFLSSDGRKLIICAENDDSKGDLDLFVSFLRKPGKWSTPINMGDGINTFAPDFSPFLASDNKTLYFASYGHKGYGNCDIFVTKRLDDTWQNWSTPKNLGPEINTSGWDAYYCTAAKGDWAYMVSSKSDLSYGLEDIFKIEVVESAKPDPVVLVGGFVFDKKTGKKINAEIKFENLITGAEEGVAYSSQTDGYKLVFPQGYSYGFRAEAEGYYAVSQNIDLSDLEAFQEKEVKLYLAPIEKGQAIRLNNIFFTFDQATLQSQSFSELNRLVKVLKDNPNINIKISGHTDSKGSDEYNLRLSSERAEEVRKYIIDHKISPNRISSQGYGESMPLESNDTDEGRQINRRVEFTIL